MPFSVISGDPFGTVMNADNASFDGTERGGVLSADGDLWIGAALSPRVRKGNLTSPGSTLVVGYSAPDITLEVNSSVVGQTITGDSGGALSPTLGNWNILGKSGSITSGSGSTLTIHSPLYANQAANTTIALNSGSFAIAAITLTTPASAGLEVGDLLEFVATNGVLVIQLSGTQVAHIGSVATTAGGTLTSTATGDAVCLRYQATTDEWWATSVIGTWVLA
jgi:hypothetical protein